MKNGFAAQVCMLVLLSLGPPAPDLHGQGPSLKIVVIQGEDAVNIVQQKTAVAPIVEVRDRNNLPVAGVAVTFRITGAKTATFAGGTQTVTVTTNAAGRAAASALTPLGNGSLEIQVSSTLRGETVSALIKQTNVPTTAASTTAPAASTAPTGGSGLSGLTIGAIAAGVAGGAIAVVGAGGSETPPSTAGATGDTSSTLPPTASQPSPTTPAPPPTTPPPTTPAPPANRPPVVTTPAARPTVALAGTDVRFSASASDAEGDPLTYTWDFGDGTTSTQESPTHIFQQGGTFTVRLTVRDKEGSASAAAPMTIKTLTGRWDAQWTPGEGADFTLTQSGTSVSGTWLGIVYDANDRQVDQWLAPISGFVQPTTPRVRLEQAATSVGGAAGRATTYELEPSDDADTLTSVGSPGPGLIYKRR